MIFNTEKINKEFIAAENALKDGNEGKARVCARRAVSFAIREKFRAQGKTIHAPDLTTLTKLFIEQFSPSEEIINILNHMSLKVGPQYINGSTQWPHSKINLLKEAKWFVEAIMSE